jgi:polyisoprenoid-binding protein YceI
LTTLTNQTGRIGRRSVRSAIAALPLAVAAFGVALWSPAGAQEATPSPTPGVIGTPETTIDCSTAPAAASTYAIASADSQARYVAEEELANKGANEAVGSTNAFIGTIYFGANGQPLACTRFDVDLRTLKSDEARRDNFLYNNTLETQQYPLATFILTSVEGLDQSLADGQETTFTLVGELTVHGVTKLVAWETKATLDGDKLTGTATTSFDMPDFDITPPKVGPVISLDEHVKLEVDITAQKQSS